MCLKVKVYKSVSKVYQPSFIIEHSKRKHKMKSHTCSICGKILASPQSLWNHKQRHSREGKSKNSKNAALADVVVTDPLRTQFDETTEDPRLNIDNKMKNKVESTSDTDDDTEDPRFNTDIKMENKVESISDTDDDTCSENNDWIWERLVIMSCYNDKFSSLDMFKTYIRLHIDSQNNSLFQSIMSDVTDAELYERDLQWRGTEIRLSML